MVRLAGDGNVSDEVTTVRIEAEPTFASEARDQWRQIRDMTKEAFGFSSVADLDTRVNVMAERFKDRNGRWPRALELWNDSGYQNSIQVLASGTPFLPPIFGFTGEDGGTQWVVNDPISGPRSASIGSLLAGTGGFGDLRGIPKFDDLQSILAGLSPIKQPSGSGRRAAAGRAPVVFDRAELTEGATERWRGMLLEEPDEAAVSTLINDYMKDANAFWMKEAGRRDFDTFVVDRIRQQARYNYLYSKKPGFQSETEYLTGFRNVVAGTGINPGAGLREIEAGASSGAGLAGFGERVSRTREARLTNVGGFGNQLAQTMAASGLGRT